LSTPRASPLKRGSTRSRKGSAISPTSSNVPAATATMRLYASSFVMVRRRPFIP